MATNLTHESDREACEGASQKDQRSGHSQVHPETWVIDRLALDVARRSKPSQ